MIRTPLRPLALILDARARGENPDTIERENLRLRHEAMRDKSRGRAEWRLKLLVLGVVAAFSVIGVRMGTLAATEPGEPSAPVRGSAIVASRADIVDREGRILATNMLTHSLYVQTRDLIDPHHAAVELGKIFPDLDPKVLERRFTDGRAFLWVKRQLSPEQMQKVHEIGDPGLLFGPREMRVYPNGKLASQILGGTRFGEEGVDSAEILGVAGIEKAEDSRLRDPAQAGKPLRLSIDLTIQAAVEDVLGAGMRMLNAKGATAILMDVHSGEIVAMASLPEFDPNDRPPPPTTGKPGDSPLFNRAVQGVYELGSTFKIFTVAAAMQLGLVTPTTMVDAKSPMKWGKYTIREFDNHHYGPKASVSDIITKSSNVGAAHIGLILGGEKQEAYLRALGLLDAPKVELIEAPGAHALFPKRWSDIVTITASYGHGVATAPLNLAAAYATIANGGVKVTPTLLYGLNRPPGPRIFSQKVSDESIAMLRRVVREGTATLADVPGYGVAGKTGTAEKPNKSGGYDHTKVINTFASIFPYNDPKYVLIVTMDEPVETSGPIPRRTAGWTSVPVAAEIIRRVGPLLGLRPGQVAANEGPRTPFE